MKFKIQNGAIEIKGNTIIERINFEINNGEHIAIVGKNGTGKTTLLKAIIDNEMLSEGIDDIEFKVIKIGKYKIGYLEQVKINEELTLFEELVNSFKDLLILEKKIDYLANTLTNDANILDYTNTLDFYEKMGGYTYKNEIEEMIHSFGFKKTDKDKKLSSFSGGEKMKISFMKLLLSNPDLLLLDEPTNHLDISTIEWLENYLKKYKKAFLIVSHDRMFLDNTVNIIYNIEYGETIRYSGNYTKYLELKQERYNKLLKDYEFQQSEIKRLTNLYERFRFKPTKAKMALSKLKQIERMTMIDKPNKEDAKTFKANMKNIPKPGRVVLNINNVSFGYNNSLGKVNLEVERGIKIGIIGANGIGKSTLLKTLARLISPLSGEVKYGYNVKETYFDQNLKFKTSGTIFEEFCNEYPNLTDNEARSALGAFLFTGLDVDKKIDVLSGGEKVRLLLCEVFFSKANLLFLDEPTNHLDIGGKEKLENTLMQYPETIIFVSHDRYFVRKVANQILVIDQDGVSYYRYGYDEYAERKKNNSNFVIENRNTPKKINVVNVLPIDKNKELSKIEKDINRLYKEIDILNNELYKEEIYIDYKKTIVINAKLKKLKEEVLIKEKEWENLVDQI